MTSRIVVLDGDWADTAEAEHAVRERAGVLGPPAVVSACTHFVTGARARVVVSLELTGPVTGGLAGDDVTGERTAEAAAHRDRTGGRAFLFPGWEALTGVLTVGELLRRSAIDEVAAVGAPAPAADVRLDTQGFVRPLHRGGRLVLHTRPASHVPLVPFEQPEQIPCCADHARR